MANKTSDTCVCSNSICTTSMPLEGCVLAIRRYTDVEHDALVKLSQHLGATVQENIVPRSTRRMLATTHLIVNAAKCNAAKKWHLPALSKK